MRVAVIVNAEGGSVRKGDLDAAKLREMFREAGVDADVRFVLGDRVGETAREALRSGVDAVVAGGGDGTIRCVAARLVDGPVPLGVLPLGTLNHFARDLKIPAELPEAVRVIANGTVHALDVGDVNGEIFINNSILGFYPTVVKVRDREREERRWSKWRAAIAAMFKVLPRHRLLRVRIRAEGLDLVRKTLVVFIGNNEYDLSAFTHGARARLDSGSLYLYVARSQTRLGIVGLLLLSLFRDVKATEWVDCWTLPELSIEMRQRAASVYVDGEVLVLDTPLRYHTRVRALPVILPLV